MSEIVLKSIRIYPIKACGGIEMAQAQMEERGFQYDWRWMLINKVLFGQYVLAEGSGLLRVGDHIQIVQSRMPAAASESTMGKALMER